MTEEEMAAGFVAALEAGRLGRLRPIQRIAMEVECLQGRPDVIATPSLLGATSPNISSVLGTPSCALVLSKLDHRRPLDAPSIIASTGLAISTVERASRRLRTAGLATSKGGGLIATGVASQVSVELWAFELKLRDWRRALHQALRCRSFAHRAYVVFPSGRDAFVRGKAETLRAHGVGALLYDQDVSRIRVLVPAAKRQPSSLSQYYHALGQFYAELDR